jgi:hypothetical protein
MAGMDAKKTTAAASRLGKAGLEHLGQACTDRIASLQGQLEKFWRDRDNYLLQSRDQFEWRKSRGEEDPTKPAVIYQKQNDSINVVGGFAEYMGARTIDDLLGSEPFFSIMPEGKADKLLAETMQRHAEWRTRRAKLGDAYVEAIQRAFTLGEGILKLHYEPQTVFSEREAEVLINAQTGEYILDAEGNYIESDVPLITEEIEVEEPAVDEIPADPALLSPGALPTAAEVLPPRTSIQERVTPEGHPDIDLTGIPTSYQSVYIPEEIPCGEPLRANILNHRDFLCPLTASCPGKADFVAHLYDLKLSQAKAKYRIDKETLELLTSEDEKAKSALEKPDQDAGEIDENVMETLLPEKDPLCQFAECYVRTSVSGNPTKLFVVVAVAARKVVFCDYLANVTPKAHTPFHVIRSTRIPNRWYGRGMLEIYSYAQDFIERQLNYVAYRNRFHANPMRFIQRDNIRNIADGEDIELHPDATFELKPGKVPEDTIRFVEFPDLDNRTWDLMQLMMQTVQLRSGVTSAAQGGVEALPQNSTATGVNAILNSGNVLSRLPIRNIRQTLEECTFYALKLIYTNLNEQETFTYLEGENAKLLTLSRDQIYNLDFDIRLTMTRFRQKEQREQAEASIGAVTTYMQIPEEEKDTVRPLFVEILKSLGQDDADRIIRRGMPMPAPMPAPAGVA